MQTATEHAAAFVAATPKGEARFDRIRRQRASFDAYRATTTDSPALSEAAYASELTTAAMVARAAAPAVAVAPKPAPMAAPAPRRVDRVWAGGDRDSDDIYAAR